MPKLPQKPVPLKLRSGGKTDVRAQLAALCYRYKGEKLQVCLVTTRGTGRWILPRGWPTHKYTPADGAAIEAFEEAGLTGTAHPNSIGAYSYDKPLGDDVTPVMVMVYAIHVTQEAKNWPEKGQRKREWMSTKKAALKIDELGLRQIVAQFDPKRLHIAQTK
ncbi:MAG: NUDIX hydrolase [Yoonia sp.]|nr:NUDIX hydrolase [Yoonia sp.]